MARIGLSTFHRMGGLSGTERLVLLYCMTACDSAAIKTTVRNLSEACGVTKSSVQRALHALDGQYLLCDSKTRNTYISVLPYEDWPTGEAMPESVTIVPSLSHVCPTTGQTTTSEQGECEKSDYRSTYRDSKTIQEQSKKKVSLSTTTHESLELATLMHQRIAEVYAAIGSSVPKNFKPDTWARDIDKMHRLDKVSFDAIRACIEWVYDDDFWCRNILSGAKLREKYPQLVLKMSVKKVQEDYDDSMRGIW